MDRRRYPPPGELVDVGGRRLHLYCTGEGNPAVILEAGGGYSSLCWFRVQPLIARFARVCFYDRAGHGWSDAAGGGARVPSAIAADLHTLLVKARVPPPYVLVGHSIGGFYVRLFAARYPREVAAVVLLDSPIPSRRSVCRRRCCGPTLWSARPARIHALTATLRTGAPDGLGCLRRGAA